MPWSCTWSGAQGGTRCWQRPGRHALFEPVHGSAPDIAGTGRANPVGAVRSAALLLDHPGYADAADRVKAAVVAAVGRGATTPDLGGALTTREAGDAIRQELERAMGQAE